MHAMLAAGCLAASVLASAGPRDRLVIRDVAIVDVERGRVIPDRTVHAEDGRIARIVPAVEPAPEGGDSRAAVIDGTGLYLMPGLFDAHVHYVEPETFGRLMIANGVTFVRDLGGATDHILGTRDRLNRGELLGPEMVAAGAIIDGDPPYWPFSEPCDTPEEARAAVRKLHEAGVDQIKVYSGLKKRVYESAVAEAHALGLKATGHIPNDVTLDEAIAAGQDGAEHLMGLERLVASLAPAEADPALDTLWAGFSAWGRYDAVDRAALEAALAKVKASGMTMCPTLVVMKRLGSLADEAAGERGVVLKAVVTLPFGSLTFELQ